LLCLRAIASPMSMTPTMARKYWRFPTHSCTISCPGVKPAMITHMIPTTSKMPIA